MIHTFCRYDLRTTDVEAARAFYAKLLGHDRAPIWQLHENAIARGAKPHWLGRIGVVDVERTVSALTERGAMALGPTHTTADGATAANLRDPGGAVVSVGNPPKDGAGPAVDVAWHALNTRDAARAVANYREVFGWDFGAPRVIGKHGEHTPFAYEKGGANVGAFADVAERAGVHTHWLYFFAVESLEAAMRTTRDAGGVVLEPVELPGGERACACDDPQGVAFGVWERVR